MDDHRTHFYNMNEIPFRQKREMLDITGKTGKNLQMIIGRLDPGFASDHSHPQEQMGFILSGEIELTIGNETRRCGAGYAYHIPANVHHSFRVVSDSPAEILDIFSPPKDENRI